MMAERDELEDILARISPEETPFMSAFESNYEKVPRKWWQFWKPKFELVRKPLVYHEWQTDPMTEKSTFGLWATKVEGGEWHALSEEWLESATEKAAAIGIRIGGKDMVYDFVWGCWRPSEQKLPDQWSGGNWASFK